MIFRKELMTAYRSLMVWLLFPIVFITISVSLGQENLPAMIKRIQPSIVVILTYNREGKMLGQGSGFFISQDGDVITNRHVLQEAIRAEVRTDDGNVFPVNRILAEDKEGDLIRVSVEIHGEVVHPLPISTVLPEVGERVIVVGSPLGLEKTVSEGIVSAVREIPEFGKIVQVTAPISPGSSGSPVVNMKGEVIGVATFYLLGGQNINFAIPVVRIIRLKPGRGRTLSERGTAEVEERLILAEQLYSAGLRFLWVEDYGKALPYFLEAVKKNPQYAEAYFQIGYCLGKLGQYQEAIQSYKQAIRMKPDDVDTYNNLCVAYGVLGRYKEGIESCKQALQIKPDLAEAYNNMGWSYHKLGRYQEAIESCKQAIRIKPDFALAHYNLGNNYFILKRYPDAMESFKQAIRINFDYAEGHLNLGATYYEMGRYPEAIESYKRAIHIKPSLNEAHLNLGMIYLRLGDRGSAIEEYKILKDLDKELANRLFNLIYE